MERGLEFTLSAGLNLDEQRAYAIAVTPIKNDKLREEQLPLGGYSTWL